MPPPTTLAIVFPKGGVGRTTTAWMLAYELARCGVRVALEDADQARHLSRLAAQFPFPDELPIGWLEGASSPPCQSTVCLIDTAPEASTRGSRVLERAQWALAPARTEPASLLALPLLRDWLQAHPTCRLLGVLPTMHHSRRRLARDLLDEFRAFAARTGSACFDPIPDLSTLAACDPTGHPYAPLAQEVITRCLHVPTSA